VLPSIAVLPRRLQVCVPGNETVMLAQRLTADSVAGYVAIVHCSIYEKQRQMRCTYTTGPELTTLNLTTPGVVHGPAASASLGCLLEMQNLRSHETR
jgi:hypothetical protein